jgi:hypothetical protein
VVHHFGVGCQNSSPSRVPSANSGTCPYCLDRVSHFVSLSADVSPVNTQRAKQDSSVHSQSTSRFLETFEAVARSATLDRRDSRLQVASFVFLRFRQQGYLTSSAPTITQRADFRNFETLKERTLRLQRRPAMLRNSKRSALVSPNSGQNGERNNNSKNLRLQPPWVPKPPYPSQRKAKYCPVPAAHSPNLFLIAPLTACQRVAANKILLHVHLACHSTPLRLALQAPACMREYLGPKANTSPIIWDLGASISVTPDLSNLKRPVTTPGNITQLKGIAKGLQINGQSEVKLGRTRSTWQPTNPQGPRVSCSQHQGSTLVDDESAADLPRRNDHYQTQLPHSKQNCQRKQPKFSHSKRKPPEQSTDVGRRRTCLNREHRPRTKPQPHRSREGTTPLALSVGSRLIQKVPVPSSYWRREQNGRESPIVNNRRMPTYLVPKLRSLPIRQATQTPHSWNYAFLSCQ